MSSFHGSTTAVPEAVGVSTERLVKLEEWQRSMVDQGRLPCAAMQMHVVYVTAVFSSLSSFRYLQNADLVSLHLQPTPPHPGFYAIDDIGRCSYRKGKLVHNYAAGYQ